MASFSFSFSGDDIEGGEDDLHITNQNASAPVRASVPELAQQAPSAPAAGAFPVQGKPQLPPRRHDLKEMLARLPSKIAYSLLDVGLDRSASSGDSSAAREAAYQMRLPRRELWDVKVQLMAEEDDEESDDRNGDANELAPGLGTHDVKTGIYEGGFKSWESSVDLVKVLLQPPLPTSSVSTPTPSTVAGAVLLQDGPAHVIELGCGTALPSLALFHWACAMAPSTTAGVGGSTRRSHPLAITVADYNPSVLYLVTLPNFLLAWALQQREARPVLQQSLSIEEEGDEDNGELELTDEVKEAFCMFLTSADISISFLSGGWSPEFIELLYASDHSGSSSVSKAATTTMHTLVLGAETIYSPFALEAFSETLLAIMRHEERGESGSAAADRAATATAIIGAKKLYFGVGGSLDDFVRRMRGAGVTVQELREEADGVRRGVVQCLL